jgi:hypothetical protein
MSDQQKPRRNSRHVEKLARCTQARQDRIERIAAFHLAGKTQRAISEICGISRAQLVRDLKLVRQEWTKRCSEGLRSLMERELARIDRIEAEAWRAWERSQQAITERLREVTTSTEGESTKRAKRTRQSAGEQAFLATMLACVNARLKLFEMMRADNGDADDVVVDAVEVVVSNREEAQQMLAFEQFRDMARTPKKEG